MFSPALGDWQRWESHVQLLSGTACHTGHCAVCSLEPVWVCIQESSAYLPVRVRRISDDLFWSYEISPFQWKLNLSFKTSNLILRTRVYLYVLLSSIDFSYLRRGRIWSWWSDVNPASVKLLKCAESLKMCSSFSRLTVIFYCKLLTEYL